MGVTINDVAKRAGVSASTVSRVLSDHPRISDETKVRVQSIVEELGYYPHAIARSLANSATKNIGIVINTEADLLVRNPFFVQALSGVSLCAQQNGYNVMFAFNKNEEEDLNIAVHYVSSHSVDGIVLFTSRTNDKCINYLRKHKFPFSVIGRPEDTKGVLWVDNDNFQATYQATDYLIGRGYNQIAFIGGPASMNVSKDRYEGYKRALAVHGIVPDKRLVFENGEFSDDFGYQAMMKMITAWDSGAPLPTAVVTVDDLQAIGVLLAMQNRLISEVAVIGFNNTPLSAYQKPTLSSVDVNADRLGFFSAKLLIDALEDVKGTPSHYIIPTALVERESTL